MQLKKVTLHYSPIDDRIRMSAELEDGGYLVLWLTLRFCRLLVSTLCRRIEDTVSRQAVFDRDFLLSFRQRAAEWQHQPAAPVSPYDGVVRSVLPERLKASFSSRSVVLKFYIGTEQVARMSLSHTELRQWLGVLYRMFQKAKWPLDTWPEWFTLSDCSRN